MSKTLTMLSLTAVVALAACSPKDSTKSDSAKVAQAGAAAAPASRGAFDPASHTATIYAKDYAFESPDSITAGLTNFHLVNEGQTLHHVQLVRIDSGKTAADLEAAMKTPGPLPAWAVAVGGPNAPDPGASSDAAFDLKEGNYLLVCFVDIPEHVPHFTKGMVRPMKVVAAAGTPAAVPTADVVISLADYNFVVKGALSAGKHTIKVENNGPQEHEVEIVRLAPGKTMKDLGEWMKTMQGPPPANAIGGIAGTMKSTGGYVTVDLTPGNYVLLCFIPDAKDGKPHVEHGMVKELTVK
jgi:uncharacterized cupredoxin-like copper-binding protein